MLAVLFLLALIVDKRFQFRSGLRMRICQIDEQLGIWAIGESKRLEEGTQSPFDGLPQRDRIAVVVMGKAKCSMTDE